MDQEKIGKFIADCRKEQGLTQVQLAEQLGITNRAVSKWETAKSMPDVSVMMPLCEILHISVNELLSGEKISMEEYKEKAEQNLMELQEKKQQAKKGEKRLLLCFVAAYIIITIISMLLYLYLPGYDGEVFRALPVVYIAMYAIWFHKYYEIKLR